jgi:hypothetical protein
MKLALAAVLAALATTGAAAAAVTAVGRDVVLPGARTLATAAPGRFDLVGLHWQGAGDVRFRTRDVRGRWSAWRPAAPEAEDLPDGPRGPWRVGNPYWTGGSDRIEYRLIGRVKRLRAYFVRSPVERIPLRRLSFAESPAIVPRFAWGADERIRRKAPEYAASLRAAIVHHTAGSNGYGPAQSAAIVRAIQRYHVLGNGWNDIGYNFLVDKYGQIFEGRYGGVDRNVIGAHAEGFNDGSTGIAVLGTYGSSGISAAARQAVGRLIAWRLDVAHVDPLSTVTFLSNGNPRFPKSAPVFLRAVSGHRDTGFTSCPGDGLYAQLPALTRSAYAVGLPKLYAPSSRGQVGRPVRFTAQLSTALPWSITVTDAAGNAVASGSGTGPAVDWTWDATLVGPGRYSYAIEAPDVRPAAGPVGPRLARLRILEVGAAPATIQGGRTVVHYRLTAPASVTIKLLTADGGELATLLTADKRAGRQSFAFAADHLPDGRYRIGLTAAAIDGQQAAGAAELRVDRTIGSFSADPASFAPRAGAITFAFLVNFRPVRATLQIRRGRSTVATIANGTFQPGRQTVVWDGRNAGGRIVPPGSYRGVLRATSSIGTVTLAVLFRVR